MTSNLIIKSNINSSYLDKKLLKINKKDMKKKFNDIKKNFNNSKNLFHTLNKNYKLNLNLKKIKKNKKFAIIGMGGSILASKSIYSFLEYKIKKKFIFLDNLDEIKIKEINKEKYFFIFISKSGNTIETLINIGLLKQAINSKNSLIICEKKINALNEISKKKNINIIEHKKYIGGRYSVFSEVGMIPAYLMGLSIKELRKNINNYLFKKNKIKILLKNSLELTNLHMNKKISSIVFLNYCSRLNNFSFWCQQLISESLGKKGMGILPIVSPAPKDHHSLLQLYLDGPKDKVFYILSCKNLYNFKTKKNFLFKHYKNLSSIKLEKVINSQKKALIQILRRKKIPYRIIHINKSNEASLGELFSYFILETALSGLTMKINPFSQDAVEEVKTLTKKYLTK